jgi:tetratricopeptide (TPR) repeat protein
MALMTSITAAHNALSEGDFDTAFDILESAAKAARDPATRAKLDLEIASIYALYGRDGVDGGTGCLSDAVLTDARIRTDPLYNALRAEFTAYTLEVQGPSRPEPDDDPRLERAAQQALEARDGPPMARFHAAAALVTLGESEVAYNILETFDGTQLPAHLIWRVWSWRGGALEDLGRYREAANAYGQGALLVNGPDKAALLLDRAAMLLEIDESFDALEILEEARTVYGDAEPPLEAASRLHLEARAHLALDNPGLASEKAERARALEDAAGEPSHGTALVHGQALAALGEWERSLAAFQAAVDRALPQDKAYAMHEMGLAQMDAGLLEESQATLLESARDPNYAFRGEVYADLAEVEYRMGQFNEAEQAARVGLELGATVPASLMLANIAYEYFRLSEALEHYQRVLENAPEGSRDWVIAHEMIADTLVQDGWRDPDRIVHHAETALPHLELSDEWVVTLEGYIQKAKELLKGSNSRTLN